MGGGSMGGGSGVGGGSSSADPPLLLSSTYPCCTLPARRLPPHGLPEKKGETPPQIKPPRPDP